MSQEEVLHISTCTLISYKKQHMEEDNTTRRQRIGNRHYYRTVLDRVVLVLVASGIVVFFFLGMEIYQYHLDSVYRTHKQEMDIVKARIFAIQKLDHIPQYSITITQHE